jgi:hypothetical protein
MKIFKYILFPVVFFGLEINDLFQFVWRLIAYIWIDNFTGILYIISILYISIILSSLSTCISTKKYAIMDNSIFMYVGFWSVILLYDSSQEVWESLKNSYSETKRILKL